MNTVQPMPDGQQLLSEKERETLRLIGRGHDAKSMARHLGLSVHTVNERLRNARRKLGVSSSREAARRLLEAEGADPQKPADKPIGDEAAAPAAKVVMPRHAATRLPDVGRRAAWPIAGVAVMSVALAILALAAGPQSAVTAAPPSSISAAPVADAPAVTAARDWLTLHDEGRWREGYEATAASFREMNTLERWTEAAQQVRPPLGAMVSRVVVSDESVPAPPAGVQVVKFRTSYANKADVLETLSLVWENGAWRVTGIYLD